MGALTAVVVVIRGACEPLTHLEGLLEPLDGYEAVGVEISPAIVRENTWEGMV